MNLWMDVMRDLEHVVNDHDRLFDAWAEGGVDGLVIGPLVFNQAKLGKNVQQLPADGQPTATYDPNPAVYRRFGVEPPPKPEPMPERRELLARTLQAAKERGFAVWVFQAQTGAGPGSGGHWAADERTRAAVSARIVDTLEHYPMADGAIMDGPEWGYEITPGYRSFIFDDLPESLTTRCAELGYDYRALVAAKDALYQRFHALDARRIRLHSPGGLLGAAALFGPNSDLAAWFAFRADALTAHFHDVKSALDAETSRPVKLGVGPRTATFAPLAGYDFARLAEFVDVLLPKHYFWHRGFDGMIGTVHRYVETLCEWNPALADEDALSVVASLFGLTLPGVEDRNDLETALSPEFFDQVVRQETVRALAVVDNPQRVVPWVDAGRFPHDGDPMSARDLRSLLESAREAGLVRFLYHHHGNLTAGEWTVMSDLCGRRWDRTRSDYAPPDMLVL